MKGSKGAAFKAKLDQQDSILGSDNNYAENLIGEEATGEFERTIFDYAKSQAPPEMGHEASVQLYHASQPPERLLSTVVNLYRQPKPSTASVMERFGFTSPPNDPMPLRANNHLKCQGYDIGSIENIEVRSKAAKMAALFDSEDIDEDMGDLRDKTLYEAAAILEQVKRVADAVEAKDLRAQATGTPKSLKANDSDSTVEDLPRPNDTGLRASAKTKKGLAKPNKAVRKTKK